METRHSHSRVGVGGAYINKPALVYVGRTCNEILQIMSLGPGPGLDGKPESERKACSRVDLQRSRPAPRHTCSSMKCCGREFALFATLGVENSGQVLPV